MEMTITEIINIIHKERVELEVFQSLSDWMVKDRALWIDEAVEQRAVVRAIHKIATQNKNAEQAIDGIISLSESEDI